MISPRRNTKFFHFPIVIRSYNPVSPRILWNTENTIITTFSHGVFYGVTPLFSRGCSETPKTRLSPRLATVFFMKLQPNFSRRVWNTGNTVVTTFSHCVFYGVTTFFPADGLKCRKHGCHNFQLSCFGVTTLFLVDGLKHRKRGCNHRETSTF